METKPRYILTEADAKSAGFKESAVKAKPVSSPSSIPWVSGQPYAKGITVELEGKKFKSKVDNNHNTPSTSATDWSLMK